jgi:hypothetical protein
MFMNPKPSVGPSNTTANVQMWNKKNVKTEAWAGKIMATVSWYAYGVTFHLLLPSYGSSYVICSSPIKLS